MMKRRFLRAMSLAAIAGLALLGASEVASASSVTYDFSHNIGGNTSVTGTEFTVTVSDLGANMVSFVFENVSGPAGSSITGIYFYDGVILGNTGSIQNTASGNFEENQGNPANLPGGNGYGLTNATKEFYSKSQGITGIYVGEELTITMEYAGTFQDLIDAMDSGIDNIANNGQFQTGDLVIGIQVQGMPDSDQFITNDNSTVIPLPAPVFMGLTGLVGVFGLSAARRRRITSFAP